MTVKQGMNLGYEGKAWNAAPVTRMPGSYRSIVRITTARGEPPFDERVSAWDPKDVNLRPLDPRLDLIRHSPTGFGWGYAGSGPAQLALAILADFYRGNGEPTPESDARALAIYQTFKARVIAQLHPGEEWSLTEAQVSKVVEEIEREVGR